MTYCIGVMLDKGMIFASNYDSNAVVTSRVSEITVFDVARFTSSAGFGSSRRTRPSSRSDAALC